MSDFNQPEYEAEKRSIERRLRLIESLGAWLVVGNAGGLALLYTAALNGKVVIGVPLRVIALALIIGAAAAFLSRAFAIQKRGSKLGHHLAILSGILLLAAVSAPLWPGLIKFPDSVSAYPAEASSLKKKLQEPEAKTVAAPQPAAPPISNPPSTPSSATITARSEGKVK